MKLLTNPYVLGFLIVVTEVLINLALQTIGDRKIDGVLIGLIFGAVYTSYTRMRLSVWDSFKAAFVYIILVGIVVVAQLSLGVAARPEDAEVLSVAAAALLVIVGLATWFALYLGSVLAAHVIKKRAERMNR